MGNVLTGSPVILFLCLATPGWLLLLWARLLNISQMPIDGGNVGFFHSYSWLLTYPMLLPLALALFAVLSNLICKRISLIAERGVIVTRLGVPNPDALLEELGSRLTRASSIILPLAIVVTLTVIVLDTAHLFSAVSYLKQNPEYQQSHEKPYAILDWTFAYAANGPRTIYHGDGRDGAITNPSWSKPSAMSNISFDVAAWLLQSTYIFMGTIWVLTYGWFLKVFADVFTEANGQFRFVPQWGIQDLNLGLQPIGILYDLYLGSIVILGFLAAWHRLSYIPINCHAHFPTVMKFLSALWAAYSTKNASIDYRVFAFDCMTVIDWVYLVGYAIALYSIIYFPIVRVKRNLSDRIGQLIVDRNGLYQDAVTLGDSQRATGLMAEINAYKKANIWPNGDDTALAFMLVIVSLYLVAVTPATLALFAFICTGLGLWNGIGRLLFKRDTP